MNQCVYCDNVVSDVTYVPQHGDDAAWRDIAHEHARSCLWILTRAHTKTCQCGGAADWVADDDGRAWCDTHRPLYGPLWPVALDD